MTIETKKNIGDTITITAKIVGVEISKSMSTPDHNNSGLIDETVLYVITPEGVTILEDGRLMIGEEDVKE